MEKGQKRKQDFKIAPRFHPHRTHKTSQTDCRLTDATIYIYNGKNPGTL